MDTFLTCVATVMILKLVKFISFVLFYEGLNFAILLFLLKYVSTIELTTIK